MFTSGGAFLVVLVLYLLSRWAHARVDKMQLHATFENAKRANSLARLYAGLGLLNGVLLLGMVATLIWFGVNVYHFLFP